MIIACILSAMAGGTLDVFLMACLVAGANADKSMKKERE